MRIVLGNYHFFERKVASKLRRILSWQKTVTIFTLLAEAANIGIVLEVAARWLPSFAALAASGPIAQLMIISDPLIYGFRALIRITRLIGRTFFKISFEEEKHATPSESKEHTIGDLVSLSLFSLSIAFFLGAIAPPIGVTLAWTMGLSGLAVAGYFDYYLPEQRSKAYFEKRNQNKSTTPQELAEAKNEYLKKKNSKRLFMALLVGLSLLLICGSASTFASPALAPALAVTSKLASIFLGGIACGRFLNWWFSGKAKTKEPITTKTCNTLIDRCPLLTKASVNDLLPYQSMLAHANTPQTSLPCKLPIESKRSNKRYVFFGVNPTKPSTNTTQEKSDSINKQAGL